MDRRGVVAEILVIIVLLASVAIVVMTFQGKEPVTSVQKETLASLSDVQDLLARAVLRWLQESPVDDLVACNGVYQGIADPEDLEASLEPYVEHVLSEAQTPDGGSVTVTPGVIGGLAFDGYDGLTITLTDGTIIYQDESIYAADLYDQEYFFNIRLPLVLDVLQDWLACDAGNLSVMLAQEFGPHCFWGKKNPTFPGCPEPIQYNVGQVDKDVMLSFAVDEEDVARAVQRSLEELSRFFSGETSCLMDPLPEDAGIQCSYSFDDLEYFNLMTPYSSPMLPVNRQEIGGVYYGDPGFEYAQFMQDDERVYSLPPNVTFSAYTDEELECPSGAKDPALMGITYTPFIDWEDQYDVALGQPMVAAEPVLYINTTRGARFTLRVTCRDDRVSLLGQSVQYSFRLRYGLKQQCGPNKQIRGTVACGGCSSKPAINLDHCYSYGTPKQCGYYQQRLTMGTIWWLTVVSGSFSDPGYDPASLLDPDSWATYDEVLLHFSADGYEPTMLEQVNSMIGGVYGHTDEYPFPVEEPEDLCGEGPVYCCAPPGFTETCDPEGSLANPACWMSADTYAADCTDYMECRNPDSWAVGQPCYGMKCDPAINECVPDEESTNEGRPCGDNECYVCDESNICNFDMGSDDAPCTGSSLGALCKIFQCDAATTSCAPSGIEEDGTFCGVPGYGDRCSRRECLAGECESIDQNEGGGCGTDSCGCAMVCRSGACLKADPLCACDEPPGGGTTCPPGQCGGGEAGCVPC